jgi:hypothetical protein
MTLTAADLPTLHLAKGAHGTPEEGVCLLEAVALFAGEPFTDEPSCVSLVLRGFGIALNDRWDDEQRQKLKPFIPRMVGTDDGQDQARSYLALDWLVRTFTPAWLDLAGLGESAAALRGLRHVADMATVKAVGPVVGEARSKAAVAGAAAWAARAAAWAARDAAKDAAWDAAGAAAMDAARDAARDAAWAAWAARDAAWAAAWDAAWAAAWVAAVDAAVAAAWAAGDAAWDAAKDAAWAAAWATLRPTVEQLQASALDLFEKMLDPSAVTA